MSTKDVSAFIVCVKQILAEDTSKAWSVDKLFEEVKTRIGWANKPRAGTVLRTLVACGEISGKVRNRSLGFLKHKTAGDSGGSSHKVEDQYTAKDMQFVRDAERKRAQEFEEQRDALSECLKDAQEQLKKSRGKIKEIRVKRGAKTVRKMKEVFHHQFEKLLTLGQARKNIMIYGPTGCGKTHVCGQLARALDLQFASVSCTTGMSEGVLTGTLLPTGKGGQFQFATSAFLDCFENGGLFLLDEMDAADPNVLLIINAALANGWISLPKRLGSTSAVRSPDFLCVATTNTLGTNADRVYAGRNKLDGATLDRFQIGKLRFDYDAELERELCKDDQLYKVCIGLRRGINNHRLERACSTRFMLDAQQMMADYGWSAEQVMSSFFTGWREDEMTKVLNEVNGYEFGDLTLAPQMARNFHT